MPQCEACIQAKHARDSFPHATDNRSQSLGELTHSDVWGPARVQSNGGSKYYISFTDDLKNGGVINHRNSALITELNISTTS